MTPSSTLDTDADIVRRVKDGETDLFEILMRRHNQRIYRIARAVVKDEAEAEDIMQQAYVNAFLHLGQFEARSQFATWLTRIALHEAFARRRRARPMIPVDADDQETRMPTLTSQGPDPERQAYGGELRRLLENSVDGLPEAYRVVFVLRDIEGLSTAEAAEGLEIGEEAVKTRLHRARAMLRRDLYQRAGGATAAAFHFHLSRCDRVVSAVMASIRETQNVTARVSRV
jgi:RNA polymerase sigma-70 factor (ECF subfamily)